MGKANKRIIICPKCRIRTQFFKKKDKLIERCPNPNCNYEKIIDLMKTFKVWVEYEKSIKAKNQREAETA